MRSKFFASSDHDRVRRHDRPRRGGIAAAVHDLALASWSRQRDQSIPKGAIASELTAWPMLAHLESLVAEGQLEQEKTELKVFDALLTEFGGDGTALSMPKHGASLTNLADFAKVSLKESSLPHAC